MRSVNSSRDWPNGSRFCSFSRMRTGSIRRPWSCSNALSRACRACRWPSAGTVPRGSAQSGPICVLYFGCIAGLHVCLQFEQRFHLEFLAAHHLLYLRRRRRHDSSLAQDGAKSQCSSWCVGGSAQRGLMLQANSVRRWCFPLRRCPAGASGVRRCCRPSAVPVGEDGSLLGQLVDVRRRMAQSRATQGIGAKIVPPGIVGHQHDDVRPFLLRSRRAGEADDTRQHHECSCRGDRFGETAEPAHRSASRKRN
jgi:hypothetical protein